MRVSIDPTLACAGGRYERSASNSLIDTTYVVEGFGEALPPRDLYFLVVVAAKAGNHHQKTMILGGLAALQTTHLAGDSAKGEKALTA